MTDVAAQPLGDERGIAVRVGREERGGEGRCHLHLQSLSGDERTIPRPGGRLHTPLPEIVLGEPEPRVGKSPPPLDLWFSLPHCGGRGAIIEP
jgi:hypothetical protein